MGIDNLIKENYEELSYLGGPQTPIRVAVLEELNSNGSLRKSELEDIFVRSDGDGKWELDISKPTLKRQFEDRTGGDTNSSLVEKGWVKDVSDGRGAESRYKLTPRGQMVCEELASLFDLFDVLEDVPPELDYFLEVATEADLDISEEVLRELADAEVYTRSPTGIDKTTLKGVQFISDSEYYRGISWISSKEHVDYYHTALTEQNKKAEFINTPEVLESLVENHAQKWGEALETGNLTVFEHDVFPLGLTIVEKGVAWGYFEPPDGTHKAELLTESDTVREWAIDIFEKCKREGREVTQEQLEKTRST